MKTIGFLVGKERELLNTLIDNINAHDSKEYDAKLISVGGVGYRDSIDYDIIYDTASVYLPFLRSYMLAAIRTQSRIINKNLYNHPNNHIYYISIANSLGIHTPKAIALPSKNHPYGIDSSYMQNLEYPLDWDNIFSKFVIPILVKKNYYYPYNESKVIFSPKEFFDIYDNSGSEILVLQEVIDFDEYFIAYTVGKEQLFIKYDPFNCELKEKFLLNESIDLNKSLERKVKQSINKYNKAVGAEINAIEVGIKDDVPFLTQFNNHHLITDSYILGQDNFEWLANSISEYLISLA